MATLYTRIYKRTNLDNTTFAAKGAATTRNMGLANFRVSGNGVGKEVGEVVSVTFQHTHTCTRSGSITIKANLTSSKGTVSSPYQTWTFSGKVATKTDTFTNVPSAVLNNLSNIQISCNAFTSSYDLYYRADSADPMILTIQFYESGTLYYRMNGAWVKCRAAIYLNGAWVYLRPFGFENGTWNKSE